MGSSRAGRGQRSLSHQGKRREDSGEEKTGYGVWGRRKELKRAGEPRGQRTAMRGQLGGKKKV